MAENFSFGGIILVGLAYSICKTKTRRIGSLMRVGFSAGKALNINTFANSFSVFRGHSISFRSRFGFTSGMFYLACSGSYLKY